MDFFEQKRYQTPEFTTACLLAIYRSLYKRDLEEVRKGKKKIVLELSDAQRNKFGVLL